jgi:1,4-alpha-glucan branching enzyme
MREGCWRFPRSSGDWRNWLNGLIERDVVGIPNVGWKEIFNSDGEAYGGWNVGNRGAVVGSSGGRLDVVVRAAGFVVFARQ